LARFSKLKKVINCKILEKTAKVNGNDKTMKSMFVAVYEDDSEMSPEEIKSRMKKYQYVVVQPSNFKDNRIQLKSGCELGYVSNTNKPSNPISKPIFFKDDLSNMIIKESASPTINTKLAKLDLDSMFNQNVVEDEDLNNDSKVFYYEGDDETISKQVYIEPLEKMEVFNDSHDECTRNAMTVLGLDHTPMTNNLKWNSKNFGSCKIMVHNLLFN
jgi:hypothetical protein